MHAQAATVIGTEVFAVGGSDLAVIAAESDNSRDFDESGGVMRKTLSLTLRTDAAAPAAIGKVGTLRGESWRVTGILSGGTFTTLTVEEMTKA